MDSDVLVVGGGPIGSTVASLIDSSFEVTVLEEHDRVGYPVQCAGLVSPRVVHSVGAKSTVLNELKGAKIHFPGGLSLDILSEDVKAAVIDREQFDLICHDRAIQNRAEFSFQHRYMSHRVNDDGVAVVVETPRGEKRLQTRCLIGADGYKSRVASISGLGEPRERVNGIQTDIDHEVEDQDRVEVFLGSQVAPGFFAWAIPCGEFTRVGLCTNDPELTPNHFLKSLLVRLGMEEEERLNTRAGVIPIGTIPRTYDEGLMVVGDAAGQTKPLSGGGLYTGIAAAECAAQTACEALEEGDLSPSSLSRYEVRWKQEIGRELKRGYRIRKIFLRLDDDELNEVGEIFKGKGVEELLVEGDIDRPSVLVPSVLKAIPSLIKFSPHLLGSLLTR